MKQQLHTELPINTRAAWRPLLKPIGRIVIAAQLALVLQPLSVLAQDKGTAPYNPAAQAQLQRYAQMSQAIEVAKANQGKSPADQVSDKLREAQELVARLKSAHTPDKANKHQELKALLQQLNAGAADVRAEFAATRAELQQKNLPAEILARHDEAVSQFEQRAASFGQIVSQAASDDERVAKLAEFFDKYPAKRKPGKQDPKKLPWSTPKPNTRLPAETQTGWFQNLYGDQKIRLAQAGGSIGPLQFSTMPEAGQAPTPADLAETDEVQITPEIRAKAQELGNNPVNIYNWVRNNIEWAPTAGAIQSAQDTLDKKRGNATDTASLLIALLRAANIPARYQWGTIDVEAAKAMNWVGGVTKPEAALQLLGQGGIAARGMISGGRFTTVRMEHVWVQAYVNWAPYRGSRNGTGGQHPNPNAQLNLWVPLDASYKQYNYTPGMDLKTAVPLDSDAFMATVRHGATANDAEGWVQNVNQGGIQNQMAAYQDRLKAFVDSAATGPTSTAADVNGRKIIPQRVESLLAGTLQNSVVLQGSQTASVPASQQHKFTYQLYASQYDQYGDSPILSFTEKTTKLVGKRLMLTYLPASQADADVVASYMPKPHADGSPTLASEFPTSLPGYLIQVKPTITLDGQVVSQSSGSVQMGTDLYSTGGFTQLYDRNQWDMTNDESNVAGQATAIGISAGGLSAAQLRSLELRLKQKHARLILSPGEVVSPNGLVADLLTSAMWSWFAAVETHGRMSQNLGNMVESPGLSFGLFHVVANPISSWGVIRRVSFPGINIDVGHVRTMGWSRSNLHLEWVAYNRARGQHMSALEHMIPERFFNDPAKCNVEDSSTPNPALPSCARGVSAMRLIGVAAEQGQRLYSITQQVYANNPGIVGSQLGGHSQSTRDRVSGYLAAGYEVSIHQSPVTVNAWTGAGFIAIDPSTGTGGYLIEGGANGGTVLEQLGTTALRLLSVLAMLVPSAHAAEPPISEETSTNVGIVAQIIGLVGEIGGLLSAALGLFGWIASAYDLASYAGCPGFDSAWALVNFLNVVSMLMAIFGLLLAPLSLAWAWLFVAGAIIMLLTVAATAALTQALQLTCRR